MSLSTTPWRVARESGAGARTNSRLTKPWWCRRSATQAWWHSTVLCKRWLAEFDPRKAQVVELLFFGGLSVEEAALVLGVSPQTVLRDWSLAKSWLAREMIRD